MIQINSIAKQYGLTLAVDTGQVEISGGGIIGLVGNNGAGKTTLFRLLLDLIRADRGEILLKGKNVAASEDWKEYTAAYLDEGFLINYLTPEEYFYFVGKLHGKSKADVNAMLETFTAFFDGAILNSGKYIRDLSKGNQCKVGVAACIIQSPELMILDEPFANLDPSSQNRLIHMLKDLHEKKGVTILVSSHDLNNIADVCTRVLLMEKGKIIKDIQASTGTLGELEAYFKV